MKSQLLTITTVFQCVLKKAICYNMFYEILSGTKTIFSEGEEDGHLERRETLHTVVYTAKGLLASECGGLFYY